MEIILRGTKEEILSYMEKLPPTGDDNQLITIHVRDKNTNDCPYCGKRFADE